MQKYIEDRIKSKQEYHHSPVEWQDQVLYFLMLDRFSDENEKGYAANDGSIVNTGTTPLFQYADDAYKADRDIWFKNGGKWCGGTLKGLQSKLGYIKRLGITAIWLSPPFKQILRTFDSYKKELEDTDSYHGYGIQNFLDIDPNFGTRQDLKDLVDEAHQNGIYVILDIILNHSGDVFEYEKGQRYYVDQAGNPIKTMDPRWDGNKYNVDKMHGFRDKSGAANLPFGSLTASHPDAWPDGAVWPSELQSPDTFTREGHIFNWDYEEEYLNGDFCSLKDIDHGRHERDKKGDKINDRFNPSPALKTLCDIYKFWIAYADVDGYRMDTVKHMEIGATRYFTSVIKEFAQSIGKENFMVVGEVAGGRENAYNNMELTGLDAVLGINDEAKNMEYLAKGYRSAEDYFNLFRNSVQINKESHVWFGKHIVTSFDDHDRISRNKVRYCGDKINRGKELLIPVIALNLTTMGIPCLYYGDEQEFDGCDENGGNDRVLRECMFGGKFGSMQSINRHFFNENHLAYKTISEIIKLRNENIVIRRGRQYLRQISGTCKEGEFGYPNMIGGKLRSIVSWSRIFNDKEILLLINTDPDNELTAWVTIDNGLHQDNKPLKCIYSTVKSMTGKTADVEPLNGRSVKITIGPAGFAAYS